MFSWMEMWGKSYLTFEEKHNWCGAYTLPRELSINNLALIQKPAREINSYLGSQLILENNSLISKTVKLTFESNENYIIKLLNPNNELDYLEFGFSNNLFFYDPSNLVLHNEKPRYSNPSFSSYKIEVFLDTSSIEIFINDGIYTFTSRIYMDSPTYKIEFKNVLGHISQIERIDD